MIRSASHVALAAVAFGCAGITEDTATRSVSSVTRVQAAALEYLIHHNDSFLAGEAELYCIRVGDRDASPELLRILHSVSPKAASGPDCWGKTATLLIFTVSERPKIDPDTARISVSYVEHTAEDVAERARSQQGRWSYTCALMRQGETWIVESCS